MEAVRMNTLTTPLPEITFRSNLRALFAIARKDWRHYWRYPLNAISSIMQPIIWLTPVYFMGLAFSVDGEAVGFAAYSGTSDYMSFILVGTALSNFIGAVFWGMGFAIKMDMDSGVLESNWMTPVPRPLLLAGRTLTSLLTTSVTSLLMLLVAGLLFGFRPTGNIWAAILTMLPMLIGLYGFGFAFSALVMLMKDANAMVDMSHYLIQIFSGANFPVQALPRWLLPVALAIPLTYGFDATRGWLLHTKTILPISWEIVLMAVFMVVMIHTGLGAFKRLERRARRLGNLSQH
jgi:ABC-2 type transport system permease protein